MEHWQTVYQHFLQRGFPDSLLCQDCITPEDAVSIAAVIENKRPHHVLEVGAFIGLSTGVISLTMGRHDTLLCVDPNLPVSVQSRQFGLVEDRGCLTFVRDMLSVLPNHCQVTILEGFFSCLPQRGFRDQLQLLGIDFEDIAVVGNKVGQFAPYDLVFLDGDHFAEAVHSDLLLIDQHLAEKGEVVLHDLDGSWANEVTSGVRRFLLDRPAYSFTIEGNVGFLARKRL